MSSSGNEAVRNTADPFNKAYKAMGQVGEGSYSKVLKCKKRDTAEVFACKRLKNQYRSWEQVNEINEIVILKKLSRHSNVLHFTDILFDPAIGRVSMIFELMEMNLYELIKDRKKLLPELRVRNIIFQLIRGLRHLHKHAVFHRDVKPENILLRRENGQDLLKIGDLGSVRGALSKVPYTEYISTRWYRSPECLLTSGYYGVKMDIWAAGCVFFEVLTLRPLFPGSSELDQIHRIHSIMGGPPPNIMEKFAKHAEEPREYTKHHKQARYDGIKKILMDMGWSNSKSRNFDWHFTGSPKEGSGIDRLIPAHVSAEARDLIKSLLQYDPELRPTAHRAIGHNYFNELREAARNCAIDNDNLDAGEPDPKSASTSALARLGDSKLKRSEVGAPKKSVRLEDVIKDKFAQKPPIKPKEIQSFTHHRRREERGSGIPVAKKTYSEERTQRQSNAAGIVPSLPKPTESGRKRNFEEWSHPSPKPPLPYEKTYVDDQRLLSQYYSDVRDAAKKSRVFERKGVDESVTKFMYQGSSELPRSIEKRIIASKRPDAQPMINNKTDIPPKKFLGQGSPGSSKALPVPQREEKNSTLPRSINVEEKKRETMMSTSMFPAVVESGRKFKGEVPNRSNVSSNYPYGKYTDRRPDREVSFNDRMPPVPPSKAPKHASVSEKYLPKHRTISPPMESPQRQSGRRRNQLENKPSLLLVRNSIQKDREPPNEVLRPLMRSPRANEKDFRREFVDKNKLSSSALRRINENRRLVQLDPIGGSDVEIRKRYESLLKHRVSIQQQVEKDKLDDSDEEPVMEAVNVKKSRKIEDIRRRVRPRRIHDIRQVEKENNMHDGEADPWNKPFPIEELNQYPSTHTNIKSYRGYREDRDDKYGNQSQYSTQRSQQVQQDTQQSRLHRRNSFGVPEPSPRKPVESQLLYSGSGRVQERKPGYVRDKQPTPEMSHGRLQQRGPRYGSDYPTDRGNHYVPSSETYRNYREDRQKNINVYSPDPDELPREYMPSSELRPTKSIGLTTRDRVVYTPSIEKPSHASGRVGADHQKPVRTFQSSMPQMIQANIKRPEYEKRYSPQLSAHYESMNTYRNYRDDGRMRTNKYPNETSPLRNARNLVGLHGPSPRDQIYHQVEKKSNMLPDRREVKPSKTSHQSSAPRLTHGSSTNRAGPNYGERRRGMQD